MADTTPLMRSLTYLAESARRAGDLEALNLIGEQMCKEQERIDAGIPEPDPAYRVDLYESGGGLYLVRPVPGGLAYDVTAIAEPGDFERAAEALLGGEDGDRAVPSFPVAWLDHDNPDLRRIATYDGAQGEVLIKRGADGVTPAAGHNGRRYIGYLEEE